MQQLLELFVPAHLQGSSHRLELMGLGALGQVVGMGMDTKSSMSVQVSW